MPTSVDVERMASTEGIIFTNSRLSLNPDVVRFWLLPENTLKVIIRMMVFEIFQ